MPGHRFQNIPLSRTRNWGKTSLINYFLLTGREKTKFPETKEVQCAASSIFSKHIVLPGAGVPQILRNRCSGKFVKGSQSRGMGCPPCPPTQTWKVNVSSASHLSFALSQADEVNAF